MHKDKGRVPDGRVFEIRDLHIETRYLHPNYVCENGDGALSETGYLTLLTLTPNTAGHPRFIERWDGGNRAATNKIRYDVDVDMRGPTKRTEKKFRNSADGYRGHHSEKVGGENKYVISIETPMTGAVFDGTISFTKHHRIALHTTTAPRVSLITGLGRLFK